MHRITRRLGDASAQRPKRVVALWLLVLLAFGVLSGAAGGTPASTNRSSSIFQLPASRIIENARGTRVDVERSAPTSVRTSSST